jgi:hypothetical protein
VAEGHGHPLVLLMDISGYFIGGYWWLFYWWILMLILLMDVGG